METVAEKHSHGKRKVASRPNTVAAFEQWEAKQKGDFNCAFYDGEISKKPGMKQTEAILVAYLLAYVTHTKVKESNGNLFQEAAVYMDKRRKPIADLAYFIHDQVNSMAKRQKEVPAFVIELLSKNELREEVEKKLQAYLNAGVQLVWYISPKSKRINACTLQNQVQEYITGATAIADPIMPDCKIDITKLFTNA